MNDILKILVRGLDDEERFVVSRRVELMESELNWLLKNKPAKLAIANARGWTPKKLHIVFCLNSFYQRIIDPLFVSSQATTAIGSSIPISYGKLPLFDSDRNDKIVKMSASFSGICERLGVTTRMLRAPHTEDILWIIENTNE